ncbi:MAG: hypothetical protein IJC04_06505 [Oscillospiraceae bacterium]|nr:hypothetical protein [Oscillospiraceae bacterium]
MEENVNINEKQEQPDEAVHIPKNTKQETVIYTIISIALFCVIYFGGKGLIDMINRPYYMMQYPDSVNSELLELQYDYARVSKEYGLDYMNSRVEYNEAGYKLSILFSGIDDMEDFAESGILFDYGDAVENVENEFYPYGDNSLNCEYVTAIKYVDNDNPNNEILIFEYDGEIYAEFQSYGAIIPTDVKILFDGCEKVY